jgi:hypothetical protein
MFADPSPGPRARRHGRRHPSSPAMLRRCSSSTSPTIVTSSSCRPRSTCSSLAKPSPPVRTGRTDAQAAVVAIKDLFVISISVMRAQVQEPKDLSARPQTSVSCQLVKFIGMCRKIQKLPNQFCWNLEI